MTARFPYGELRGLAIDILRGNGLADAHAVTTAEVLLEADLLGYKTHGVDLLPIYAEALAAGEMATNGAPEVVRDMGANVLWEGRFLPGQVLICQAIDLALERLPSLGVVTVVIRHSQHTGCHAAYLARATAGGAMMMLTAANNVGRRIAPFGGTSPVFSPSPFAFGIPGRSTSIHLDMTMASTANSVCRQHYQRGDKLPYPWLLGSDGVVSDDPATLYEQPTGTILPLGGLDNGHKGFGLLLMVEAMTLALSGSGHHTARSEPNSQSVFLQLIDPAAFGGAEAFDAEVDWIVDACHGADPIPGRGTPRVPGERAQMRRQTQLVEGVEVAEDVCVRLAACASGIGRELPARLS